MDKEATVISGEKQSVNNPARETPLPSNTISGNPNRKDSGIKPTQVHSITFRAPDFSCPDSTNVGASEVLVRDDVFATPAQVNESNSPEDHNFSGNIIPSLSLVGLTILQTLDCPHKILRKSRVPHSFPKVQAIPWPGPEQVPNLGLELANPG